MILSSNVGLIVAILQTLYARCLLNIFQLAMMVVVVLVRCTVVVTLFLHRDLIIVYHLL